MGHLKGSCHKLGKSYPLIQIKLTRGDVCIRGVNKVSTDVKRFVKDSSAYVSDVVLNESTEQQPPSDELEGCSSPDAECNQGGEGSTGTEYDPGKDSTDVDYDPFYKEFGKFPRENRLWMFRVGYANVLHFGCMN